MRRIFFFILFLSSYLIIAQVNQDNINITSRAIVNPVFIGNDKNLIETISIELAPDSKDETLTEICFETDKYSFKNILKSIKVFSVNNTELRFLCEENKFRNNKIVLPLNHTLRKGRNSFKVSVDINKNASLDSLLMIKCVYMKIGSKKHMIDKELNKYLIGHILRKPGDDNVNCYRIPGLVTTNNETLLAVYDIRKKSSRDLPGDIDIGIRRSTDKGQTWEPNKTIIDMGEPHDQNGVGDPSILVDKKTKTIWVAGLWSHGNRGWNGSGPGLTPEETGQFVLVKSDDNGLSWSKPINITSQVKNKSWKLFFQGPGNGISLKNGTLVFPAQYRDSTGMPYSTIIHSSDNGNTWKTGTGAKQNTTEAQVVELQNGNLMLNMRDNRGGYRSIAVTTDLGNTWFEHKTSRSALIEPVCMASFIRVFDLVPGNVNPVLAFSNPNSKKNRDSLTVKFSTNDGDSWNRLFTILIDEKESFGYSCLTKIDNKHLGLLYEGSGEIYFVKIKINNNIKKVDINDFYDRGEGEIIRKK